MVVAIGLVAVLFLTAMLPLGSMGLPVNAMNAAVIAIKLGRQPLSYYGWFI